MSMGLSEALVGILLVPCVYVVGALFARLGNLYLARVASVLALAATALVSAMSIFLDIGGVLSSEISVLGLSAPTARLDAVSLVVLSLVTFIGFVLVRFSSRYLAGEARERHYLRWLLITLALVSLLVISNNLVWLGAAWVGTSLALHQLLTFFSERPRALIAAHKKFLISRIADVCLLSGIGIVGALAGGFELDVVYRWAGALETLPPAAELACVLFVLGASLKCAQLPFHGWLTQVMEAPTPVSALLHAGVVNIGGFLMIRLAPLMVQSVLAQTLLVLIGTLTAVVASLVMMTRVSVKVSLAWSTSAQMGFMLLQCGLGAYHLALLHLVAHSLYKAHAFLSSASTVERWRASSLLSVGARRLGLRYLVATPLALAGVVLMAWTFGISPEDEPALLALGFVLALSQAPMLARARSWRGALGVTLASTVVLAMYFAWSVMFSSALPHAVADGLPLGRLGIALVGFTLLFTLQVALEVSPRGRLARWLHPHLYAGLYLDALFTRVTFRVWPARLPSRGRVAAVPKLETLEV